MSYNNTKSGFHFALDRYRYLTILNAANVCKEYQFAKQATMLWLVNYPNDLLVKYYQGIAFSELGKVDQAKMLFKSLVEVDPSFIEPYKALKELVTSNELKVRYQAIYDYLVKSRQNNTQKQAWLEPLWEARNKFDKKDHDAAMQFVHQSLLKEPPSPLPAILHLKIANKLQNQDMLATLSDIYHQKWPKCLQVNIIKAITEIDRGEESAAVERLHWVEANDNAGQVITQLMGSDHRFRSLWPDQLEVYFDLPIPASVNAYLGWNQLYSGQTVVPEFKEKPAGVKTSFVNTAHNTQQTRISKTAASIKTTTESPPTGKKLKKRLSKKAQNNEVQEIQKAFSKIAKHVKNFDLERTDNRFPVYVILSSKKHLETVYGPNTAGVIDNLLRDLVAKIQSLPDWDAKLYYPDDAVSMAQLGIKPIIASDAWQVKLALADLDTYLDKKGEMVGALLIVGGPEIIPYHHLPNPTNDNDLDVPSDNPYGTIDENYFIPQWPVGRLPGETGPDAGLLLSQIRALIYQYEKKTKNSKASDFNIASILTLILDFLTGWVRKSDIKHSLGYSAEIWKEASKAVYKTAGQGKELQLSPPIHFGNFIRNNGNGHQLGYFNLHGIKDGANWYGQKDFASESSGPDYPIALSPNMFDEKKPSPKLVFTEACYGANILEKKYDDAIALKFLDSGTKSFAGSTCISYGSVTTPLIAADFLADAFWHQILEGQPAGYALMHAKLNLVEEMTKKQGYLDGEDQKTLLSFVLFGDPLAVHDDVQSMPKPLQRVKSHKDIKTISDSEMQPYAEESDMSEDISKQVQKIIMSYLPGLQNAQMHMNKSYNGLNQMITGKSKDAQRYVVTLQKSLDQGRKSEHYHYARITLNEKGKVLKFTTSR